MAKKQTPQADQAAEEPKPQTSQAKTVKPAADEPPKKAAAKKNTTSKAAKEPAEKATAKKTTAKKTAAPRSAKATDGTASRREPSQEDIARRAYEIYLERGGRHGNDADDWLRAERELRGS